MNYNQNQNYSRITYRVNNRIVIDKLLNELHTMQLDYIDEALEKSDLAEATALINMIRGKL
jgi:glutathionylspermidine synthase